VIGRGAFGTVYRADFLGERGARRRVAFKVLDPDHERSLDVSHRLSDEVRLLGMLSHRAIVRATWAVTTRAERPGR